MSTQFLTESSSDMPKVRTRLVICALGVLLSVLGLIARYAYLQIYQHDLHRARSDDNRIQLRVIGPKRGLIVDRNGLPLVGSRPSYGLSLLPNRIELGARELPNLLAELLDRDQVEADRIARRLRANRRSESIKLPYVLSERQRARLAVNRYRLKGVKEEARARRYYNYGKLYAHIIGYVGGIEQSELDRVNARNYRDTDVIGKIGIEQVYERDLHGKAGYQKVEIDAFGRLKRVIESEQVDSIPGSEIVLHIDHRLQKLAFDALRGRRGAVVALEPASGGVLAAVSQPSFDPNLFITGMSQEIFLEMSRSEGRQLFNRALQGQYSPGSIIKPVYALAGLFHKVVDASFAIDDPGRFHLAGETRIYREWKRKGHGPAVNLSQAVIESCDVYFYNLSQLLGLERLRSFSGQFGLGAITGIDATEEYGGLLPSDAWKRRVIGQGWVDGDTVNLGIGQGYLLMTPLQMAVMSATLANRGLRSKPRFVKSVGGVLSAPSLRPVGLDIDQEDWQLVIAAMRDVVSSPKGTARRISSGLAYSMAAKTGTVQVVSLAQDEDEDGEEIVEDQEEEISEAERDHSLFIAFAPIVQPRIAIAVVVENAGDGSQVAAPIARRLLDAYLSN